MKEFTKEEKENIRLVATLNGDDYCASLLEKEFNCGSCIFGGSRHSLAVCGSRTNDRIIRNKMAKELWNKINNNFQLELFK